MKALQSWKALFIVIGLFVIVAAMNIIVRNLAPVRLDTTAGQTYTLSKGTGEILKKAKESGRPVTIRLYVSGEEAEIPKALQEYAKRVEDLLEEYAKVSGNAIVVQAYTPVPNSIEEDAAILDGVLPRNPLMDVEQTESLDDIDFNRRGLARQPYFFGLSVSSLQHIETIPFLDPKQEANLEYELSRAIASVTRKEKFKIGLLEGSDISMAGQPAMMGGRGAPPWTIYRYLQKDFEIVSVPFDVQPMKPGDKDHPFADLDLLLIVHPVKVNHPQSPQPGMPPMGATTIDNLSPESQYAIDQFVVRGGKVLAFVDNQYMVSRYFDPYSSVLPFKRSEKNPPWLKDLMSLFDSQKMPNYRSGLDELYKAWGVRVGGPGTGDPVLIDPKYSRPVAYPRPVQGILQSEFRLVNQLRQIPDQRWTQAVVQSMEQGAALMADFSGDALTEDHPITRNLSSVRMVDPSPIQGKPANGLKMRTLVRASPKAKALPGEQVGSLLSISRTLEEAMAKLEAARAMEEAYPVAVLLEGTFKSAFESDPTKAPEPEPEDEPPVPPAPPINPPLLPPGAPDSLPPPAPEPAPAPESAPAPDPAPEPAPSPPPETTPAPATAPAPDDVQPGEPAEGDFPNPQNPEPAAEPATPPVAEPATPPIDEPATPPVVEPATPPVADPATEPVEPAVAPPTPPADPAADGEETKGAAEPEAPKEVDYHLAQGTETGTVAIVSDVDMLFDFFLGDPNARGGQRAHDNLAFVFNLIESLVGDQDLISVRRRSSSHRPFKVIDEIRSKAAAKQATRRADIQQKMEEANKALMEGQLVFTQEGELQVQMDAERAEKLELARAEIRDLEQQQRLINREERKVIQGQISSYKWANMLLTPLAVILLGFAVGLVRKIKTAAK